ncbi:hypothetical protein [uncultured Paraglaciecola sp.]|uniref:hypothetical protein n=1 Tax=uncultured Paraglaciecola sp. TaxID=1765024 RepID=UPI0030D83479|tara:strand:- start:90245 stop:90556 length:312 start_codon:yes stop_codon:yes gene_type:complete
MNFQEYSAYCYSQLVQVFNNTLKGQPDDKLKFRTEGLLQAGKLLGYLSREDATELMNMAHIEVFGQTIEDRKNHKENIKKALTDDGSDFFTIPAYERRGELDR